MTERLIKFLWLQKVKPWRRVVSLLILAVLMTLIAMIFTGTLGRYRVISSSMSPTLRQGDFVLADQRRGGSRVMRDDIIVFKDPHNSAERLTKRVIGLPGERIQMTADQIIVAETFVYDMPSWKMRVSPFNHRDFRLSADEVFLLGDNRDNSHDSMYFGPVHKNLIIGRVVLVYWPPRNAGWLTGTAQVRAKELQPAAAHGREP